MRKGEIIEVRCITCNNQNQIHIDDFKARESKEMKMFAIISVVVTLVIALLVFFWLIYEADVTFVWLGMFGLPFFIYGSLIIYDKNRVSTFNKLFVRR
jgi:protein-S-isoprenylcysteine O-methyltransferase Ste14